MKQGDFVRVKDGTQDPDFKDKDLSGYTGYIESITDDEIVQIIWDDQTLKKWTKNSSDCAKRKIWIMKECFFEWMKSS